LGGAALNSRADLRGVHQVAATCPHPSPLPEGEGATPRLLQPRILAEV
jgi:hypothetical protein